MWCRCRRSITAGWVTGRKSGSCELVRGWEETAVYMCCAWCVRAASGGSSGGKTDGRKVEREEVRASINVILITLGQYVLLLHTG